jgi:hypothetical protein
MRIRPVRRQGLLMREATESGVDTARLPALGAGKSMCRPSAASLEGRSIPTGIFEQWAADVVRLCVLRRFSHDDRPTQH